MAEEKRLTHRVRCAVCGKRETIEIVNRKIPENWFYFGRMDVNACKTSKYLLKPEDQNRPLDNLIKVPNPCYDPKAKPKLSEYWECQKCAVDRNWGLF